MSQYPLKTKLYELLIVIVLISCGLLGAYLTPASRAASYSPPGSIASDCSAETGDALSNWLATVPDGSTISFPTNACYLNNKYIKLTNRNNLTFEGNNTTFRRTQLSPPELSYPTPNPHWWFLTSTNIIIRNMKIEGTNNTSDVPSMPQLGSYDVDWEFEAAFRVERITTFTAEGITATAVWGDGFQLQSGTGATVRSSTVARNGRQALSVVNESNVLIDGVTITSSRRAGIDLENDTSNQVSSNIEIRNTSIWSWLLALPAGGPGAVNNVYIHNNTITRSGTPFIYNSRNGLPGAVRRSDWRIENNVVATQGSPSPAILMDMTDNVTISGNTVPLAPTQSRQAISFKNAGGNLNVKNNYFNNASSSYVADSFTGAVTACSNKLIASGDFDQPIVCPPEANVAPAPSTPSPTSPTSENSSPGTSTSADSSSSSDLQLAQSGNSTQNPSNSPIGALQASGAIIGDSSQPMLKRITHFVFLWLLMSGTAFGIWWVYKHKAWEYLMPRHQMVTSGGSAASGIIVGDFTADRHHMGFIHSLKNIFRR